MATLNLHQRPTLFINKPNTPLSPKSPNQTSKHYYPFSNRTTILTLITLIIILGIFFPYITSPPSLFITSKASFESKWKGYSLKQAVEYVSKNDSESGVIVCIVSEPYLSFLNNWLISIVRVDKMYGDRVLVIAEDYNTLFFVNERWPGHAVLIPPVVDASVAHKFGSQGFFNFTARRPQHLLQILELGYSVMYNDVDMVWLADPFPYLKGKHDVYFMDDMTPIKPLDHPNVLPPPGKKGRTYICSCLIYMHPTPNAKFLMKKWIEELQDQPWSRAKKANDQPAFNWALNKTAGQVDMYLLPQAAFPTGGLYFKNKTWVKETKGKHVLIHNNYIVGFEKKIKRFHDYSLWLADDLASESPLGRIE